MKEQIKLFGDINSGWGTDGNYLSQEITEYVKDVKCTEIELLINSFGGSMSGGFDILSPIRNCPKPIGSTIEGFACSMASVVSVSCNKGKRKMVDYGLIMIHNPYMPDAPNYEELEDSQKIMVDKAIESCAKIYANATGQSIEKIKELMSAETWLDANEALELGFIDEIIYTGIEMPQDIVDKVKKEGLVANFDRFNLAAKTTNDMKKIIVALGLTEGSEDAIVASIGDLKNALNTAALQVKTLTEANASLNTSLNTYLEKEKEEKEAKIVALVENAVKERKISNTVKDEWLEIARVNLETAKKAIDAMPAQTKMVDAQKQIANTQTETKFPTMAEYNRKK
jgi:ATP-dependent Clp endopeptidase proteolytic subunit ClpP